jgi:hypothetical protein
MVDWLLLTKILRSVEDLNLVHHSFLGAWSALPDHKVVCA